MTPKPIDNASPTTPGSGSIPFWTILLTAILCLLAIANVYWGRVIHGPPDLYRKDQCKTMAYTVDMVVNHRFSLPRDPIFQPATKPPLYNWLAAVGVAATGQYGEWVQKWPSIVSAIVIAWLIFRFCRRQFAAIDDPHHSLFIGLFASAIWIVSKSTVLLLYIARPDMLQALFLIGGWICANQALGAISKQAARRWAIGFWITTTAAALTKGPAAVYPMFYALLAAPIVFGNWRKLTHLYWHFGVPFLLISVGAWLAFAYRQDPQHVTGVLLGVEVYKRIASSNPEGYVKPWWYSVQWWYSQNTYWSYLAIGSMLVGLLGSIRRAIANPEEIFDAQDGLAKRLLDRMGIRDSDGLFTGAAGMATLWTVVVVGCISFSADKRQDFLLPAHPASAILAAHFVMILVSRFPICRYVLPMVAALVLMRESKSVTDEHLVIVAGVFMLLGAAVSLARKSSPNLVQLLAGAAVILFLAFEVGTNTRLGIYKTPPTLTFIAFFAGGAAAASLVVFAFPKQRLELPLVACGIIYWSCALLQNSYKFTGPPDATSPSLYATRFAREAAKIVGNDKVVSIFRSKHPILTFMGRHQGSYLTRKDFEDAQWVIVERSKFPSLQETPSERLFSGKIDVDFGHVKDLGHDIMKDRIALIRIDKEKQVPSVDEMIAIHLWVQDWSTADANPYRSPNTGWIDTPGTSTPAEWKPAPGDPWYGYVKERVKLDRNGNPIDEPANDE